MNVELIKIDQDVARAKLLAYRKGIAARAHGAANERVRREYEQIEAGYKAAARGLPLIELSKAMAMGGWDEQGRPRFAVAKADQMRVACDLSGRTLTFFCPRLSQWRRSAMRYQFDVSGWAKRSEGWNTVRIEAIVPVVPPDVLPRADLDLSRRVILWEADWKAAPVDPLLLLPIGGDLYAVEACWDLTPLERAVIAGRAT